jgi:hypothetical protein
VAIGGGVLGGAGIAAGAHLRLKRLQAKVKEKYPELVKYYEERQKRGQSPWTG